MSVKSPDKTNDSPRPSAEGGVHRRASLFLRAVPRVFLRPWIAVSLSCLGVLVLLWIFRVPVLRFGATWLNVGEQPSPAEYVMVLAGDENVRPFAAAALVKAGFARGVLLAEIKPTPTVKDRLAPPAHAVNREVLIQRGVPERVIQLLPGQADSTHDEAMALAAFLCNRPDVRVLVMTTDSHTRRARLAFCHALADGAQQVTIVAAPTDLFCMDYWWRDQWGFTIVASEYLKLAFYALSYGQLGWWLLATAVLVVATLWLAHRRRAVPESATA